jgi:hypothetical protein
MVLALPSDRISPKWADVNLKGNFTKAYARERQASVCLRHKSGATASLSIVAAGGVVKRQDPQPLIELPVNTTTYS